MINDIEVKEAPTADVVSLIWELRRVGNNIDQILIKANSAGFIDVPLLRKALKETQEVEERIVDAYTESGA